VKRYIILIVFLIAGTVLFQGFQCASPEMTTAKLAFRNNEWAKVEEFAGKELAKNPRNGEAKFLLSRAKIKLNKSEEAAKLILEADKLPLQPEIKQQIPLTKFMIWTAAFNSGITQFNNYMSNQNRSYLDSAIRNFEIAQIIRPENAEFDRLIGRAYEELGNEEKTLEYYTIYTKKLKNEIEWAKNVGIFIKLPRRAVTAKLGKTMSPSVGDKLGEDSVLTDVYSAMGRPIYIYYSLDDRNEFIVEGWRVNPPGDWMDNEKTNYTNLDINPFATLAQHFFNTAVTIRDNPKIDSASRAKGIHDNLEVAKEYTKIITAIDPTNIDANRFLISLYEAQGKSDDALSEIAKLVELDPENKFYLAQYGELFLRLNKFDEAITQYLKALKIDPEYCDVNRNIAAAYKNKAVIIIQQQEDKKDKDKNYKENPDEYKPLLMQSADYFKKCRSCEKYRNDLQVLSELANLYFGLSNLGMSTRNDLNSIVDDLERMEQTIADEDKEVYWLKMCKILGDMQSSKSARACSEAKKYMK